MPSPLLTSILLDRSPTGVTTVEPLARLAPHIAPAILIAGANTRVCCYTVLGLSKAGAYAIPKARQAFVRRVHAARQAVADKLDRAPIVWDLHEALALGDMDGGKLDAVGPVRHAQLKGDRRDGVGEVGAGRVWRDQEVCGAGADIGELPVEAGNAVAHQHAVRGKVAEAHRDCLAGVTEFDPRCAVVCVSVCSTRKGTVECIMANLPPPRHVFRVPSAFVRNLGSIGEVAIEGVLCRVDTCVWIIGRTDLAILQYGPLMNVL